MPCTSKRQWENVQSQRLHDWMSSRGRNGISSLTVAVQSCWPYNSSRKSWVELGDMSFDAAKSEYVSLVRTLDSTSLSNEFAPRQSTLMNSTSSEDWEIVSNAFHFASIGDIDQVDQLLSSSAHCIDSQVRLQQKKPISLIRKRTTKDELCCIGLSIESNGIWCCSYLSVALILSCVMKTAQLH